MLYYSPRTRPRTGVRVKHERADYNVLQHDKWRVKTNNALFNIPVKPIHKYNISFYANFNHIPKCMSMSYGRDKNSKCLILIILEPLSNKKKTFPFQRI